MQQLFMQESLAVLIAAARRRIKQVAWDNLRPWCITPQQSAVLLVLHSEGSMPLGRLACRIWCDNPTACRIVTKLVERGMVVSTADAHDRRRFNLQLTSQGTRVAQQVAGVASGLAEKVEEGFSPSERTLVRSLLQRVIANMDAAESCPLDTPQDAASLKAKTPRSRAKA